MITIKITQWDMSVNLNITEDIFNTQEFKVQEKNLTPTTSSISITDWENQIDFDGKVKKVCMSGLNIEGLLNDIKKRDRKTRSNIRLSREDWQILLDDLHNWRTTTWEIKKSFWVGQSTISVKYKTYRENNLRAL